MTNLSSNQILVLSAVNAGILTTGLIARHTGLKTTKVQQSASALVGKGLIALGEGYDHYLAV